MTISPNGASSALHLEFEAEQDLLSCNSANVKSDSKGSSRSPPPQEVTHPCNAPDGKSRKKPSQCVLDAQQRDNANCHSGIQHTYNKRSTPPLLAPLTLEDVTKSNALTATTTQQIYYARPQPHRPNTAQKRKPFHHSLKKSASFDSSCEGCCPPSSLDQEGCSSSSFWSESNNSGGVNNNSSWAHNSGGAALSSSADVESHSQLAPTQVGVQSVSCGKTRNGNSLLPLSSSRSNPVKEQLGGGRSGGHRQLTTRCILPVFYLTRNKSLMLLGIISIVLCIGMTTTLHSVIDSAGRAEPDREKVGSQIESKYTYTDPNTGSITIAFSPLTPSPYKKMAPPRIVFYSTFSMEPFSILPLTVRHPHFAAFYPNETEISIVHNSTEITLIGDHLVEDSNDDVDLHQPKQVLDPMLRVTPGEESAHSNEKMRVSYTDTNCVPMQEWQEKSFPNCNSVHELDMGLSGQQLVMSTADPSERNTEGNGTRTTAGTAEYSFFEDKLFILGRGWFRHTWKVDIMSPQETVVLKTLRLEREFYDEFYELHRRDAIAMERLTHSPYIIDVYGFCGQTAINEFADFIEGFHDFQAFAKQMRNKNDSKITKLKLQIAVMLALGVAHIHEIDGVNNATMVHYDINPKNVAIVSGGKPKLNDFNVAEFLRWDTVKNERCGFKGRLHEPWWRAPEEMYLPNKPAFVENGDVIDPRPTIPRLDEKVDVYSLGNILHNLLTGHSPRGRTVPSRVDKVRADVKAGKLPYLSDFYRKSTDPAIRAMRRAIRKCYVLDPARRSTAREVANDLLDALKEYKSTH